MFFLIKKNKFIFYFFFFNLKMDYTNKNNIYQNNEEKKL